MPLMTLIARKRSGLFGWRMTRSRREALVGFAFLSPWIIGLLLLKLLPILASLVISFTDFYMLRPEETHFIGLANYAQLFHDPGVGYTLFATLSLAIYTVPLQLVVSLILATLLTSPRLSGKQTFRTLFFLPSIIPSIAILVMWIGFLDPNTGWLSAIFGWSLGVSPIEAFNSEGGYNLLMALQSLWSIGPGFLIMLGALLSVPVELYEAARVDGAGPLTRFFSITLPMISPAIFFSLIINLIGVAGGTVLLDRGNIFSGSVSAFDGYIDYVMFSRFELGYAASLAWVFLILMMVVIVVVFRTARYWVFYPEAGD